VVIVQPSRNNQKRFSQGKSMGRQEEKRERKKQKKVTTKTRTEEKDGWTWLTTSSQLVLSIVVGEALL